MAAYVIFIREGAVVDAEALQRYRSSKGSNPAEFGLTPLVVYGDLETVEGKAADGVVVLQFPSMEQAKAWYYSPGYQAAMEHRKKAADYRVIFVEGI